VRQPRLFRCNEDLLHGGHPNNRFLAPLAAVQNISPGLGEAGCTRPRKPVAAGRTRAAEKSRWPPRGCGEGYLQPPRRRGPESPPATPQKCTFLSK
jgi:hypothetical protein